MTSKSGTQRKTPVSNDRALFRTDKVQRAPITKHKERAGNARPVNPNKHKTIAVPRVRASLSAGTVAILLAGPYKGRRVVVVKALASGNIAVTGPYQTNGVSLRRVNPRFVIGTSTKVPVDASALDFPEIDDAFFNKEKTPKKQSKKTESEDVFMSQGKDVRTPKVLPEKKVQLQKKVDAVLEKVLGLPEHALLKQYLKTRFTLRDRMYPHALKF